MRMALLAAVLLGVPALASAQSASGEAPGLPPIGLPLPPIGLPLPPIGLPLAPIGLPAPPRTADTRPLPADPARPGRGAHRGARRPVPISPAIVVVAPWHWIGMSSYAVPPGAPVPGVAVEPPAPAPSAPPPAETRTGILRLELERTTDARIVVDGYYVGTLDDLGDELALEPGPHAIELEAEGHEPLAFQVRIAPDRTITYRGTLTRTGPAAAAPPPVPRSTMYLIPGCYLGNVHPKEVALPRGCDLSRLITREP